MDNYQMLCRKCNQNVGNIIEEQTMKAEYLSKTIYHEIN